MLLIRCLAPAASATSTPATARPLSRRHLGAFARCAPPPRTAGITQQQHATGTPSATATALTASLPPRYSRAYRYQHRPLASVSRLRPHVCTRVPAGAGAPSSAHRRRLRRHHHLDTAIAPPAFASFPQRHRATRGIGVLITLASTLPSRNRYLQPTFAVRCGFASLTFRSVSVAVAVASP